MSVGSILIADDEETFRESTARLLRHEGFECHCVKDGEEAVESLKHDRFDVLVSDVRMPRNPSLQVVREAHELDPYLAIILVTGYPSLETAIRGIDMGVYAYLTKPVDFGELFAHVRKTVERARPRRRLAAVVERLHAVVSDLELEKSGPRAATPEADGIVQDTIRTLASCLSDLLVLRSETTANHERSNLCDLLDCPQRPAHRTAILHAIEVLEKTKDNFRSKQLAELRMELARVVEIK